VRVPRASTGLRLNLRAICVRRKPAPECPAIAKRGSRFDSLPGPNATGIGWIKDLADRTDSLCAPSRRKTLPTIADRASIGGRRAGTDGAAYLGSDTDGLTRRAHGKFANAGV